VVAAWVGRVGVCVVSMQPVSWSQVPADTARVARAAFPKGSLAIRLRDELGLVFQDTDFVGSFGARGRPGISPAVLMLVTVLQFVEHLTDRQAVLAVAGRIDWKYALGLELDDPGFDDSVLCEFRARLVEHDLTRLCFDRVLDRARESGVVKAGGKQRTDATHVIGAVRDLNRSELAGESVRALTEALATVAPGFLAQSVDLDEWAARYGSRVSSWSTPGTKARREELALAYGRDGRRLLDAIYAQSDLPWLRQLPQVAVLCTVLRQTYLIDVRRDGSEVMRRRTESDGVPPAHTRLAGPYDLDARWAAKGEDLFWCGYKVHLTETCDDPAEPEAGGGPGTAGRRAETPNLITNVHTTVATVPDSRTVEPIHRDLAARGLAPSRHYLDSGYPSAAGVGHARDAYGITMITPLLGDNSAQARAGHGYARDDFAFDHDTRTTTCPQGQTSSTWNDCVQKGKAVIVASFIRATCHPCPARDLCTTSARGTRQLTVPPREIYQIQQANRTAQHDTTWQHDYKRRAGIEGTMNQAANTIGLRKARYRGLKKVELEHRIAATAINLTRLDAYFTDQPLNRGHTSRLLRLQANLTN
jgi:transposase